MTTASPKSASADANRKPPNLVLTSVLLAAGILYPYLYGIWAGPVKPSWFLSALLSSILLWFYWRGYGWARYLTLLGQAIAITDALSALNGRHLITIANFGLRDSRVVPIGEILAGIYVFGWLLTPAARRYFSAEALHDRESLNAGHRLPAS